MAFLRGIARAGGLELFGVGNGRCDTDYVTRGAAVIKLLEAAYEFIFVHVYAPDDAARLGNVALNRSCIESMDHAIIAPVVQFFKRRKLLGGVMVLPDHYTDTIDARHGGTQALVHTDDAVPFALWDGHHRDSVQSYSEKNAKRGSHGTPASAQADVLPMLFGRSVTSRGQSFESGASAEKVDDSERI